MTAGSPGPLCLGLGNEREAAEATRTGGPVFRGIGSRRSKENAGIAIRHGAGRYPEVPLKKHQEHSARPERPQAQTKNEASGLTRSCVWVT
jgi:hypothetical protein